MKVLLVSESAIKREATEAFFGEDVEIVCWAVKPSTVAAHYNAEQPVEEWGIIAARLRIDSVPDDVKVRYDVVVAIENSIEFDPLFAKDRSETINADDCVDVCNVIMYFPSTGEVRCAKEGHIPFPKEYWDRASVDPHPLQTGFNTTIGQLLLADGKTKNDKNWFPDFAPEGYRVDRRDQICIALTLCRDRKHISVASMLANVRFVPDFPQKGVLFQDIQPVLADTEMLRAMTTACVNRIEANLGEGERIDYVIGIQSRGFVFGALLAHRLKAGFVWARKPGKMPRPYVSVKYGTEYSEDEMLMSVNIFKGTGKRALIVDDLIGTGGSIKAAAELVAKCDNPPVVWGAFCPLKVPQLFHTAQETSKAAGVPRVLTLF